MSDQLPVIVFMIPFATAILLPLVGQRKPNWCGPIALASTLAMAALAIINLQSVLVNGETRYGFGGWSISTDLPEFPLGIEWVNDSLAAAMLVTVASLASLCQLFGRTQMTGVTAHRSVLHHTLVLIMVASLSGIVLSGDVFNVFVFFEVSALCAYALVGVAGGKSLVAAFRYLILGTLGSSFYLLGVVFFYAATGTLNMSDLALQFTEHPELMKSKAVIGGSTFLFLGLGIKMALFPLHGWLPAAYSRAPSAVSPLLAGLMTKVSLYVWVRIMFWVLGAGAEIGHVHLLALLGMLGMVAAVAGALLAVAQTNVKRIFAYGGISHVGLILIGVSQGNQTGFAGSMYYMVNDAVMQAGAFLVAGAAISMHGARSIDDCKSLRRSPWIVTALIVLAMGMVGVPPTGGFFGKWQILLSAMQAENYLAVGAIVVATLLTMAYFQRLFVGIFGSAVASDFTLASDAATGKSIAVSQACVSMRISLAVTSLAIILLGVAADPMLQFFRDTAISAGL